MRRRKNRRYMAVALVLLLAAVMGALIAGVNGATSARATSASVSTSSAAAATTADDSADLDYEGAEYSAGVVDIALGDAITVSGKGASVDGTTVTIEAAGVYYLSGSLDDGQIVIDAKGKVYLEFNGVDVTNSGGPALYVADAKKVTLTLAEGTSSSLTDSSAKSECDAALYTNDTLVINGKGSLAVTGNCNEGIAGDDDIVINAGTLVIKAVDDGINAHDEITITGGNVYIVAGGDGLDSNGGISISGGKVIALASDIAGDGGLDAVGEVTITGGTVIAAGNSIARPSGDSTQVSVYVTTGATQAARTSVSVVLDGEEILAFTPDHEYQNLLISSDDLLAGTIYEVYIGASDVPISVEAL